MKTVKIKVANLKPHPRNYNEHPEQQIIAIAKSLEQHGQYRNIVIANDNTILAGHGVVLAAEYLGWEYVRAVRMDFGPDEPQAIKLLAADNTLAEFSAVNDRELTELLKEIREFDEFGLEGTGFDDMMLANLVMVTRMPNEIETHDEAAEWLGMPGYQPAKSDLKYTIIFRDDNDRRKFAEKAGLRVGDMSKKTWSTWWPAKDRDDVSSVIVDG